MRWNPSKTKEPGWIGIVGVLVIAAVVMALVFTLVPGAWHSPNKPYAGGALLDSRPPMDYEEDEEIEELGRRLVALAAGEEFTDEQIEQLKVLVASIFHAVRVNGMGVEFLEFKVDKLESGGGAS